MQNQSKEKLDLPYITPAELARRWQCSRSSVDRIARRAGLSRICPSDGKNGIIRYYREEIVAYENSRRVTLRE